MTAAERFVKRLLSSKAEKNQETAVAVSPDEKGGAAKPIEGNGTESDLPQRESALEAALNYLQNESDDFQRNPFSKGWAIKDGYGKDGKPLKQAKAEKSVKDELVEALVADEALPDGQTLEEHDRRHHPKGYHEGDTCKFREKLATETETDNVDLLDENRGEGNQIEEESETNNKKPLVTPEEDKAYLEAVENGDMETAQKMLEDVAKRFGFTHRGFHGTPTAGFTEFSHKYSGDISKSARKWFSFTSNRDLAEAYSKIDDTPGAIKAIREYNDLMERFGIGEDDFQTYYLDKDAAYDAIEVDFDDADWEDENGEIRDREGYNRARAKAEEKAYLDLVVQQLEEAKGAIDKEGFTEEADRLIASLSGKVDGGKAGVYDVFLSNGDGEPKEYSVSNQEEWDALANNPDAVLRGVDSDFILVHRKGEGDLIFAKNPNQIKSADTVTKDDKGNVVPLSKRFDSGNDIRGDVSGKKDEQKTENAKQPPQQKPKTDNTKVYEGLSKKQVKKYKELMEKKHPEMDADLVLTELGKIKDRKAQECAFGWAMKGAIKLPEDAYKVEEAITRGEEAFNAFTGAKKTMEAADTTIAKAKEALEAAAGDSKREDRARQRLDNAEKRIKAAKDTLEKYGDVSFNPMDYDTPMGMIEAMHGFKRTEKPITVEELKKNPLMSDYRDEGYGVETFQVEDSREGQQLMRQVLNTHWGKDANPWCLLHGDGEGNLSDGSDGGYDAWEFWENYNALPKRVAFKDGKLLTFMATDGSEFSPEADALREEYEESDDYRKYDMPFDNWLMNNYPDVNPIGEQWWDRKDEPHRGIPLGGGILPNDKLERRVNSIELFEGEITIPRGQNTYIGEQGKPGYKEWYGESNKIQKEIKEDGTEIGYSTDGEILSERKPNGDYRRWFMGSKGSILANESLNDGTESIYNPDGTLLMYKTGDGISYTFGRFGDSPRLIDTKFGRIGLVRGKPVSIKSKIPGFPQEEYLIDSHTVRNSEHLSKSVEAITKMIPEAKRIYEEKDQRKKAREKEDEVSLPN